MIAKAPGMPAVHSKGEKDEAALALRKQQAALVYRHMVSAL